MSNICQYSEYNADGSHIRSIPTMPPSVATGKSSQEHPAWDREKLMSFSPAVAPCPPSPATHCSEAEGDLPGRTWTASAVVDFKPGRFHRRLQGCRHDERLDSVPRRRGRRSRWRSFNCPSLYSRVGGQDDIRLRQERFSVHVARSAAADDTVTSKICNKPGELVAIFGPDRRVVVYPTNDNQELNFRVHPPQRVDFDRGNDDWNNETGIERLLEVYRHFDPSVRALLAKANPAAQGLGPAGHGHITHVRPWPPGLAGRRCPSLPASSRPRRQDGHRGRGVPRGHALRRQSNHPPRPRSPTDCGSTTRRDTSGRTRSRSPPARKRRKIAPSSASTWASTPTPTSGTTSRTRRCKD